MEDLFKLKVGDNVLCTSPTNEEIVTVTEITKTDIVTSNGKFNRATGKMAGNGSWYRTWIKPLTIDDIRRLRLKNLKRTLHNRLKEISSEIDNMDEKTLTLLLTKINISDADGK